MAHDAFTLDMACAEAEAKITVMAEELLDLGVDLNDDKVVDVTIDFLWSNLSPEAHALFRAEASQGRSDLLLGRIVDALQRGGHA